MTKNHFIIAFRTLLKNKVFSTIHILGLAIGISASLVIYLLVDYHFSFDHFEKDRGRIYRAVSDFSFSGEVYRNSGMTSPMGPAMRRGQTGLEAVVPFRTFNDEYKVTIRNHGGDQPFILKKQTEAVFVDSSYFNLIGYKWIAGSPELATREPNQVVLTVSRAKLYFPQMQPSQSIGQQVVFDDTVVTTVAGIVKDIAENTDFSFKTFISKATLEQTSLKPQDWDEWNNTNSASQLLLKLAPGTSTAVIEKAMYSLYDKNRTKDPNDNGKSAFRLQPLSDLHFNQQYGGYSKPLADKSTLYGLLVVASFLLLLGCINFINLSTANAAQRSKEIGIRKTLGSSRKQLVYQFLSETFLLTTIATLISIALTPLILKAFSGFIPDDLHFNPLSHPGLILFLLALMMLVTLLSGFYPALVLSGYKPVLVLKNQAYSGTARTRKAWLRKSLTLSQFVIAQIFIMAAILVSKQIYYSVNKDLGFKKEAILSVSTNYYDTAKQHRFIFMEKLRAIPGIALITLNTNPPSSNNTWSSTMKYKDGKKEIETDVEQKYADTAYLRLFGIRLLAGQNYQPSDTLNAIVINDTYAKILGFQQPGQAIGKMIEMGKTLLPVVGVVADFHQRSLHAVIKPIAIGSRSDVETTVSIALKTSDEPGKTWKKQ